MALPSVACTVWVLYIASLAIYRLYLSPLAKFPGPKLAALTRWYEAYYDIALKGKFGFNIQDMHKKYGPIVRIAPDELHIQDSDFWDELYVKNPRADKPSWWASRFGNEGAIFSTSNATVHRRRKGALNPMFSRRSILNFQPVIREKAELLCKQIAKYKDTGAPLVVNEAFPAFSGDIMTEYAFGVCYNHVESPNFSESLHSAFMAVAVLGHAAIQFPLLHSILNLLPDSLAEKLNPAVRSLLLVHQDIAKRIKSIINKEEQLDKTSFHRTVFDEVLDSDLPPEYKTAKFLADEAQSLIGAGTETVSWALCTGTFHIINTPRIYKKLRDELFEAIPDASRQLDCVQLEKLPYLRACIHESARLSYGVCTRSPRVPDKPLVYKDWVIPARTTVSMTVTGIHHDENIFPDSHSFVPERWLGNPKAPSGFPLDHYFVSFGKGPRSCLGVNLAYVEMFLAFAMIFRRFGLELYETDISDVELKHDLFIPFAKLDSKGVRVRVKEIYT